MLFNISEEIWKEKEAYNTVKEILQQPTLWKRTLDIYKEERERLNSFFEKIKLDEEFDIVFTGAGTSEYVGNILAPLLRKDSKLNFKSIGTTDILNNPLNYLRKDKKLLLVSFARSGDSPESLGVVDFVDNHIEEAYHLFITCNKDGALAKRAVENSDKCFKLLMPEESNDKGFAMTSSFSCMLLTGILVFGNVDTAKMEKIANTVEKELENKYEEIKELAERNHDRIVILGNGYLAGLAQELSLKIMELSAGKIVSVSNTTLGFRHGPKAIVNDNTIIFTLISENNYARQYDKGLLEEMYTDETNNTVIGYSITREEALKEISHKVIYAEDENVDKTLASIFVYLVYGQMYAFFKSQYLGNTTDNPFPSGEVNRVVKKFKVYKYGE